MKMLWWQLVKKNLIPTAVHAGDISLLCSLLLFFCGIVLNAKDFEKRRLDNVGVVSVVFLYISSVQYLLNIPQVSGVVCV